MYKNNKGHLFALKKKKKLFATFCFDNINAPYAKYFMRQAYSEGSRVEGKF